MVIPAWLILRRLKASGMVVYLLFVWEKSYGLKMQAVKSLALERYCRKTCFRSYVGISGYFLQHESSSMVRCVSRTGALLNFVCHITSSHWVFYCTQGRWNDQPMS